MRFPFFSSKATLSLQQAIAPLTFLAGHLPEAERPEIASDAWATLPMATRDDVLRRIYLDIEARVLRRGIGGWADAAAIRSSLRKRFRLDRGIPSRFTVLFAERSAQLFSLFRLFAEEVWQRAGWGNERITSILRDAAAGTPLAALVTLSEEDWNRAFRAWAQLPSREREAATVTAFRRVVERTYRDFVKERGESRARIAAEEAMRAMQESFGPLEGFAGLVSALPESVLSEERITFAPREELAETVTRQAREMKGKDVALFAEAQKLQETIRDLKQANAKTEAMAHAQEDFISVVSHQFRTPLSAIRWEAEALLDAAAKDPNLRVVAEAAEVVRNRSVLLVGVLENIFDLLAIESGTFTLHLREGDLGAVILKSCSDFEKEAQRRGMALRCVVSGAVRAAFDSTAIERVVRILLTNALEYSEKGGTVEVGIEPHLHEGGREFIVRVRDEGIGIRAEDRPRIFEKFFRTYNAKTKAPNGAGIALYIAKRIVELHRGTMSVESKGIGTGATFSFSLPEDGSPAGSDQIRVAGATASPVSQTAPEAEVASAAPPPADPLLGT